jgi:hypothetical protein
MLSRLVMVAGLLAPASASAPATITPAQFADGPKVMFCEPYGVKLPGPKFPVAEDRDA